MSPHELVVALLMQTTLVAIAVGLLVTGRWRLCWSFSAYVPVVLTGSFLCTSWGEVFWIWSFAEALQFVLAVLKLGLACEVAWRVFRVFPRAATTASWTFLLILLLTAVPTAIALAAKVNFDYVGVMGQFIPYLTNSTIWLFAGTLTLAQWYRIPVHPLHGAILTSFGIYLAIFGIALRLWWIYGEVGRAYVNALDPLAYLLLTLYWSYVVWRPETVASQAYTEALRNISLRTSRCW